MDMVTVFNDSPSKQAKIFEEKGSEWLHIVDLNGAFKGEPINSKAIFSIVNEVSLPVQLGGGIRDMATIDMFIRRGVRRVILGTAAVKQPSLVRDACKAYPNQVVLSIDARDGRVAVEGWVETAEATAVDMARRFEDAGAAAIVYTDIGRDGAMQGPNIDATLELANVVETPVILSGGVSSMNDLIIVAERGAGLLEGVISGRAIYDGHVRLTKGVALLKAPSLC